MDFLMSWVYFPCQCRRDVGRHGQSWRPKFQAGETLKQMSKGILAFFPPTPPTTTPPQTSQSLAEYFAILLYICSQFTYETNVKGTQDWDFFWLRFWNLYYFFVSYVKILRFYKKKFWIWPFWGEVRFFRVVLGLRGIKIVFNLGQKKFFFNITYDPFIFAKNSFSKIRSINCVRDGFQCLSWAKMSKFIPLSLRQAESSLA
jgi:hypothetical protein